MYLCFFSFLLSNFLWHPLCRLAASAFQSTKWGNNVTFFSELGNILYLLLHIWFNFNCFLCPSANSRKLGSSYSHYICTPSWCWHNWLRFPPPSPQRPMIGPVEVSDQRSTENNLDLTISNSILDLSHSYQQQEQANVSISRERVCHVKCRDAAAASQQPHLCSLSGRNLVSKHSLTSRCWAMGEKNTSNQSGSRRLTPTWTCRSALMLTCVEQRRSEQHGTHRVVHAPSLTGTFGGCHDRKQTRNVGKGSATTSSWATQELSPSSLTCKCCGNVIAWFESTLKQISSNLDVI